MKLITLLMLVTTCSANEPVLPQFNQQPFPFPLQFQLPQLGAFVTEHNHYLPPDSHTSVPYFPQKNTNDLQYQYLPPTGSKIPTRYPPPFPMFSTTFRPNDEDEEEDDEEEDNREYGSSTASPFDQRFNQSRNSPGPQVEIPNRPIPKTLPYFNPIDRIDTKFVSQPNQMTQTASPFNIQPPTNRRMIQPVGFVGNQNDQVVPDQMKTGSHIGHHYLPAPQVYGSTTEPAIPILRLSNEMDLDGSYSYEALSADQTHVMQHGHVENLGTDHAENVVEGSYSYVGDNGQTYTVHYIADGNGFRASGDHLPVPPPVPEIIQRSIEYNIAEEASPKSHQSQNNYRDDEKSNQVRTLTHHYQPPMTPPPPRSLFTGRQPEAFSHNHNGATSSQNTNLQQAASTQTPIISHYEAPKEPPRLMNAPISPQITFLASQGAHNPSESISRMYSPPNDGPVFRFGNLKNKLERDPHKNIWPYQHSFSESATKIPQSRNSISRSSIDTDDVMINFSDMSPEQYARTYHSHINPADSLYDDYESKQSKHKAQELSDYNDKQNTQLDYSKLSREFPMNFYQNQLAPTQHEHQNSQSVYFPYPQNWYSNSNSGQGAETSYINNPDFQSRSIDSNEHKTSLVTKDAFVPQSHTIMSSYDVNKDGHEARQILYSTGNTMKPQFEMPETTSTTARNFIAESNAYNTTYYEIYKSNTPSRPIDQSTQQQKYQTTQPMTTTQSNIQKIYQNSVSYLDSTQKPQVLEGQETYSTREESSDGKSNYLSTSTETFQDVLKTNVFLKNLFNKNNESFQMVAPNDNWRPSSILSHPNNNDEKREHKEEKNVQPKIKTADEHAENSRKTVDVSQIANLVTLKNYFESNKIKPRLKHENNPGKTKTGHDNHYTKSQQQSHYKLFKEQKPNFVAKENTYKVQKSTDFNANYPKTKSADMDRAIGVAKIYKTLQRNSKLDGSGYGETQLQTNLMPPAQGYNTLSLPKSQQGLPPLGRAGPSMKSYLPPVFS